MKISAIGSTPNYNLQKASKRISRTPLQTTFQGIRGQQVGTLIGGAFALVASVACGPIALAAIATTTIIGGSIIGDKIEDKMNNGENNSDKDTSSQ